MLKLNSFTFYKRHQNELNKYIFSETINTTDDARSNMRKYKDTYHSFNLGLKLDLNIYEEFSNFPARIVK